MKLFHFQWAVVDGVCVLQVSLRTSTDSFSLKFFINWGRVDQRPDSLSITVWGRSSWCHWVRRSQKVRHESVTLDLGGGVRNLSWDLFLSSGVSWLRLHYEDPPPTADQISRLQNALVVDRLGGRRHTHTLVKELLLPS